MTVHYAVYSAIGVRYICCQTAVSDCSSQLRLFIFFNEHIIAALLFKCMEEPAFGFPLAPYPTPSSEVRTPPIH